jgi:signal transduction histidine kinase
LRHARRRIVEAAADARRQIERDLHDGAQQQLVSLALDLGQLRARLGHEPQLAKTVQELADKLADALAELRELARAGARVIRSRLRPRRDRRRDLVL